MAPPPGVPAAESTGRSRLIAERCVHALADRLVGTRPTSHCATLSVAGPDPARRRKNAGFLQSSASSCQILYADDACRRASQALGLLVASLPDRPARDALRGADGCATSSAGGVPVQPPRQGNLRARWRSRSDRETAAALVRDLRQPRGGRKTYIAVVRGAGQRSPASSIASSPRLQDEVALPRETAAKPAQHLVRRLSDRRTAGARDRYPTSRPSVLELHPETGRRHQLRRHLAHSSHPDSSATRLWQGRPQPTVRRVLRRKATAARLRAARIPPSGNWRGTSQSMADPAPNSELFARRGCATASPRRACGTTRGSDASPRSHPRPVARPVVRVNPVARRPGTRRSRKGSSPRERRAHLLHVRERDALVLPAVEAEHRSLPIPRLCRVDTSAAAGRLPVRRPYTRPRPSASRCAPHIAR